MDILCCDAMRGVRSGSGGRGEEALSGEKSRRRDRAPNPFPLDPRSLMESTHFVDHDVQRTDQKPFHRRSRIVRTELDFLFIANRHFIANVDISSRIFDRDSIFDQESIAT
jgi:hypothetical protein